MEHDKHFDEEDLDGFEASLRSLRPRALPPAFTDETVVESVLADLSPKDLSADFADIVALECSLSLIRPKALPEGFADRVAAEMLLRDLTPRALAEDFTDRVAAEIALREVTPRDLPAGFVERVVAASLADARPAGRIITFRRLITPLSAAAALAFAAIPFALRHDPSPRLAQPAFVAASETPAIPEALSETDSVSLPVVSLPDGRAYRPVIRNRYVQEVEYRATPMGVAMPVAARAAGTGVDYEPVMFE